MIEQEKVETPVEEIETEGNPPTRFLLNFQDKWPLVRAYQTYELLPDFHSLHGLSADRGSLEGFIEYLSAEFYRAHEKHTRTVFPANSSPALGTSNVVRVFTDYDRVCRDITLAAEKHCFGITSYNHDASDHQELLDMVSDSLPDLSH